MIEEILATRKARLALSLWNLVEIGAATDKSQRERRLAFLEKFNPRWTVERVNVQRQEVESFLWKDVYGIEPREPLVFTPHLSVVDLYHAGADTRLGLTARQWIAGVDFNRLEQLKNLAPNALNILQAVGSRTFKRRQQEIFIPWIKNLIPRTGPDGMAITAARRDELLDHCAKRQDSFFGSCKSLRVEDALTTARVANPDRVPQRSDGIDLMQSVMALAYCDLFLVRDRFVRNCSELATKALSPLKLAAIYW